jgi:putative membrane protein
VVPGVSGGTIALVTGIYERLVASIRSGSSALGSLIKGDFAGMKRNLRDIEWVFLLLILGGILTAVLSLAHFIEVQLEENPVILAAAFFGLVLGSIVVASRMIRQPAIAHVWLSLVVGVATFVLLGIGSDVARSDPGMLAFFGSAALAICAMILPGISGSLILVLIGMYDPVLGAVNDRDLTAVAIFVLGAIVGLAFFSQILHVALRRWHDLVLAGLIGLMVGSLRILWPWPDGVQGSGLSGPEGDLLGVLLAVLIGFGVVLVIARLAPADTD